MSDEKLPLYVEAKDEKELELFLEVLTFVRGGGQIELKNYGSELVRNRELENDDAKLG